MIADNGRIAVERTLTGAVPGVGAWRAAGLPRPLESGELRGLLASCDRRTAIGRRDFAIVVLMSRATMPSGTNPTYWQLRLTVVRGFARYLQTIDPTAEVPPSGLLPAATGGRRPTPYVYCDDEIAALLAAAGRWRSRLGSQTLQTLIGLLAVTGMRIGEAIRL